MMADIKNIIESLLFVTEAPLTVDRLKTVLDISDAKTIREALNRLSEDYETRKGGFYLRLVAGGYQWFGLAPHMLDLKVAPFLGAIIISDAAWRRVPNNIKDELMSAAREVATQIDEEVRQLEAGAVDSMREYGLEVHVGG